jgi:hypothetical protein
MLKSKSFRWLIVLILAAIGLAGAAVTGSIPPFADRPHGVPPPPEQKATLTIPEAVADQEKPVYTGPLGEFFVGPRQAIESPPCPEPRKRTENYKFHELYSPVLGGNLEVFECANGLIPYIARDYAGPGKAYFVGPAKVPYTAPLDRLMLLTIGGHSAIAQLPIPGFPGTLRIAAIERFPDGRQPGIMVAMDNVDMSLKEASAIMARLMGVQP